MRKPLVSLTLLLCLSLCAASALALTPTEILQGYGMEGLSQMEAAFPQGAFTLTLEPPSQSPLPETALYTPPEGAAFSLFYDTLRLEDGGEMLLLLDLLDRVEGSFGAAKDLTLLSGDFFIRGLPGTDLKLVFLLSAEATMDTSWSYAFETVTNEEGQEVQAARRQRGRRTLTPEDWCLCEVTRVYLEGEAQAYFADVSLNRLTLGGTSKAVVYRGWIDTLTTGYSALAGSIDSWFGYAAALNASAQEHLSSTLISTRADGKASLIHGKSPKSE